MITLNEASPVVQLTSWPVMSTECSHIGIKDKSGCFDILSSGYFSSYKTTTACKKIIPCEKRKPKENTLSGVNGEYIFVYTVTAVDVKTRVQGINCVMDFASVRSSILHNSPNSPDGDQGQPQDVDKPDLGFVKPDTKVALHGERTQPFENILLNIKNRSQDQSSEGPEDLTSLPTNTDSKDLRLEVTSELNGAVTYIDGLLSAEECRELCSLVDSSAELSFWSEAGRHNEKARSFRDADTLEVKSPILADGLWQRVKDTLSTKERNICIAEDDQDNPQWERELPGEWLPTTFNHDLLFAKYPSGGAFAPHTDGRAIHDFNRRSFDSVIVFLNDIPAGCGGGTRFYTNEALRRLQFVGGEGDGGDGGGGGGEYGNSCNSTEPAGRWSASAEYISLEVQPRAGRVLVFDQALVHEGIPPLNTHLKYIIRSDVMYQRKVPLFDSSRDIEAYNLFKEAETVAENGGVEESISLFRRALKMSPGLATMMGQA